MNTFRTIFFKNRKNIATIAAALVLHIISLHILGNLQNLAYVRCSPLVYAIVKFLIRWLYLSVPICFMRMEHLTLKDIGITTAKLSVQIAIGIVIGSMEALVIVGLTVLLGFKEQLGNPMYDNSWLYVLHFFYTIFAVGLFEELFFRGYIYKKLLDIVDGKWFSIIISSLIFGVCHFVGYGNYLQAVPQVLVATMTGVIYCIFREKIRGCTLISLIFMHGIYDFWIAFVAFIS